MSDGNNISERIHISELGADNGLSVARELCRQSAERIAERFPSSRGFTVKRASSKDTRCELRIWKGNFCSNLLVNLIFDITVTPAGKTERHPQIEFAAGCGNRDHERLERICHWLTSGSTIVGLATITPILLLAGLSVCLFILFYLSAVGAFVISVLVIIAAIFIGGSVGEIVGRAVARVIRSLFGERHLAKSATDSEYQRCFVEWTNVVGEIHEEVMRLGTSGFQAI